MSHVWTETEIRALGVRTDLVTACSIVFGCGRTKAYELHAAGELPFPVFKAGNRLAVPTAPILRLLGICPDTNEPGLTAPQETGSNDDALRQQNGSYRHGTPNHAA